MPPAARALGNRCPPRPVSAHTPRSSLPPAQLNVTLYGISARLRARKEPPAPSSGSKFNVSSPLAGMCDWFQAWPSPFPAPESRVGQRAGRARVAKSRGLGCSSPPWSVGLSGRGVSHAQAPPAPREKQGEMPMPRAFRVDREVSFRHLFPSFDQARVLAVRPRSWHWPCTPGPLRGPGHCFKMAAYRPRAQVFATRSD